MANTTNYNWETPDDTDLVKDGAAAIRTLGNSVDTTTKALNPETTLGDIAYRSATSNTNTRLPIGTAGQILAVSGGVPAWINNDQGDITEVQAGTGISVASGTGCEWMCSYCANTLGTYNYYFTDSVCTYQTGGCVGNPIAGKTYTCCSL